MRKIRPKIAALVVVSIGMLALFFGCASQTGSGAAGTAPELQLNTIASVAASESDDEIQVVITADNPLTFSSLKQPDPLAVVLYFPETEVDQTSVLPPDDIDLISAINTRRGNGQRTARVEIRLAADTAYTAAGDGNTVVVRFNRVPTTAAAATAPSAPAPQATAPLAEQSAPVAAVTKTETSTPRIPAAASGSIAWVNKVDFVSEADGKSTLMVGTTQTVEYRINKSGPRRVDIHLFNTNIPSYQQRPLITTRFNSAVDRVTPAQPDKAANTSVVSVELRESVPYVAEQVGNLILVHFEASSIPPKPLEQANLPAWKQVAASPGTQADMTSVSGSTAGDRMAADVQPGYAVAPAASAAPTGQVVAPASRYSDQDPQIQAMLGLKPKVFTGEKIALDFYETDIKNVFRILREVSGRNFAIDKDVKGKVTMTLDKPVPWDQVLDLVLRMNHLGMVEEGTIIRIATLETLKLEDELKKAKLESLRKAQEEAKMLEPLVTKYIAVSYSNAKDEVAVHLLPILTPDRGSISVDSKNNQIIITDTEAVVAKAEEVIRQIDKVTSQVIIEAKVVEVTDNFSRELGIVWTMEHGPGSLGNGSIFSDVAMNYPSPQGDSSIGINFSRITGVPFVLDARLNAMESTGEGRILSSPKILTLDNKKAMIKQGVEYAYLERDSSGGSSVKFKDIDLLLEVTPHVTPDNRISMIIFITKNDVADLTDGVPSVATNEAETELLVNDGDTVVIGGIIKKAENRDQDGFPGLKNIPFLGWLFKNSVKSSQKNELLIFITPRIVQLEQVVQK